MLSVAETEATTSSVINKKIYIEIKHRIGFLTELAFDEPACILAGSCVSATDFMPVWYGF